MEKNNKFPKEFKECPICYSKETVCRMACADEPSIPKGTFVSLVKEVTPIQDLNKLTTPTVKAIMRHYDICWKCGFNYCTKVEIISLPVQIQHHSGDIIKRLGSAR